jgi:hypothetical protein
MKSAKTFKERIEEHNQKVKMAFERAKLGEVICLTDLMISKEILQQEEIGNQQLKSEVTGDEFEFEK